MEPKVKSSLPHKTVRKIIKVIEKNSESYVVDIDFYDEILRKYEEENKHNPPKFETTKDMQSIFLSLITMLKRTSESQIKFNKTIIEMLNPPTEKQ